MKAQETVMNDYQINKIYPGLDRLIDYHQQYIRDVAKAQAEITWPIAHKEGFNEALNTVVATREYDEGKEAGMKEVVEWIKKNRETPLGKDPYGYYVWEVALLAQCKEWGL